MYTVHKRSQPAIPTQPGHSTIDFSPATEQDKAYSNSFKDQEPPKAKDPEASTIVPNDSNQKDVQPSIVDVGKYGTNIEARGYASGVVENGGTCSFVFTNGATTITKQTAGAADAATTRCENLTTPASEFGSGSWTLTLKYGSPTANGSSEPHSFEVK